MFPQESLQVVNYFSGVPGIVPRSAMPASSGTFRNASLGAGLSLRHLHSSHKAPGLISSVGKRKKGKARG